MDIKKIRNLYALSQSELAEVTNIPIKTIQSWESGARKPAEYIEGLLLAKLQAEYNTLQLITDQESGIVLYGNNLIVCNWSFFVSGGLPSLSPLGELMVIPNTLTVNDKQHIDSVYNLVKDCDVIFDRNGDIAELAKSDCDGYVYMISDGAHDVTVIAPKGWE